MIVADNTLLVHLGLGVAPAEQVETARRVHARDADWRTAPLWASEFRSVSLRYVRRGDITIADALEAIVVVSTLVTVEPVGHDEVLRAAHDLGLSGYDAEYAALAVRLGVPLVTSDRQLREAVPGALDPDSFAAG